jgi:5-(carboxyamino)imidazole ribonucleotide synthase
MPNEHNSHALAPGACLGVLGGGQLGRMWAHAAQQLGYTTAVLDPDPTSPAGLIAHQHIQADYLDEVALRRLVDCAAAVTTEFENVPAAAMAQLAHSVPVSPSAQALAVCQDRALEKAHFARCGVACAPHRVIQSEADLVGAEALVPGILKTARMGYDGKGQVRVHSIEDLPLAWKALGGAVCVLEKKLPLELEISVIVARGRDGAVVALPPQQNLHRDGILAVTQVPAPDLAAPLAEQAVQAARAIADSLVYVGVLCVEFFVLEGGELVANEMAPRPHNSGHYSIDACDVSQFELQVRVMADLPLVQPRLHSCAVMLNLLGDLWFEPGAVAGAPQREPDWARVLAIGGAHLHLYGKSQARIGRKMGHLTITASTPEGARAAALQAAQVLGLAGF